MKHICVSKLTFIVSDNGLSTGRCQAITWTNAGILLIGPLGTNFNEILIEIYTFSFKKINLKMSSGKCRPFCLGLNVLILMSPKIHALLTRVQILKWTKFLNLTMLLSHIPCVHSCSEWHIVGYGTSALWDLWDEPFDTFDAGDGIFWLFCWSIPCLLMPWLLNLSEHQQTWDWLCRTDNTYYHSRGNFI